MGLYTLRQDPDMNDTTDLQVDATNTEQLKAWDGGEGDYWAAHADEYDAAVDSACHAARARRPFAVIV